jgi:hypothetical protein
MIQPFDFVHLNMILKTIRGKTPSYGENCFL